MGWLIPACPWWKHPMEHYPCPLPELEVEVKVLVTQSCPTFVTPWTVACQAPLSMGFSRQEYWNGLPCPPAGDLPDPGVEPVSPTLEADFFSFLSHHLAY